VVGGGRKYPDNNKDKSELMMEHQSNVVGSAAAAFIQTLPAWNSQRNRPKSLPSFSDSSCGPTRQIPVNLQTWQNLDTHSQLVQKNKSKNKKKIKCVKKLSRTLIAIDIPRKTVGERWKNVKKNEMELNNNSFVLRRGNPLFCQSQRPKVKD
jgi:hypothetical protein